MLTAQPGGLLGCHTRVFSPPSRFRLVAPLKVSHGSAFLRLIKRRLLGNESRDMADLWAFSLLEECLEHVRDGPARQRI
jgi:hypothetical protein